MEGTSQNSGMVRLEAAGVDHWLSTPKHGPYLLLVSISEARPFHQLMGPAASLWGSSYGESGYFFLSILGLRSMGPSRGSNLEHRLMGGRGAG